MQGEVAGPTPSKLSPFLVVHHGARTCGRKKIESRVRRGVMSTNSWDSISYFQYLGRAVREKA